MFIGVASEMTTNPSLGVMIFTLGGLAGAVFYLPFKKAQNVFAQISSPSCTGFSTT